MEIKRDPKLHSIWSMQKKRKTVYANGTQFTASRFICPCVGIEISNTGIISVLVGTQGTSFLSKTIESSDSSIEISLGIEGRSLQLCSFVRVKAGISSVQTGARFLERKGKNTLLFSVYFY